VIVFFYCLFISVLSFVNQLLCGGRRGRDHMVVGFTTTCVLNAYKTGSELRCSRRVGSSCSTSDTCRVTLVISHDREKDLQVLTASGTYLWSFVT
jgi:hypothetical protein